jgi:hypothetical protein
MNETYCPDEGMLRIFAEQYAAESAKYDETRDAAYAHGLILLSRMFAALCGGGDELEADAVLLRAAGELDKEKSVCEFCLVHSKFTDGT